jgi:glutathione S-transferase
MKLSFIYLNFPFWRAEVSKISLYLAGIEFENRVILSEEFQRVKTNGKLDDGTCIPHHQLPCLLVDGQPIVQTGAIARFCGKLAGLYPIDNDFLAAQIDQFIDFSTDITVLVSNTGRDDSEQEKQRKREALTDGELGRKLNILEKNIKPNGDWIVRDNMGLEDIAIWRLMGWLSSGTVDGIPTHILQKYPNIKRVCLAVDEAPKVQDWVKLTYKEGYNRGNYN